MDLLDKIRSAGIVGAGGAGFPTHIKLDCRVEHLLINAAECEPLLHTDKYIMNTYPSEIISAAEAVAALVSAGQIHIAVKKVNTKETASLQNAIERAGSRVRVFPLDNYYPAGDEQMIVYDITGRVVPPAGLPLEVGAVVSNVATLLNIYDAMSGRPVTHKFLTVTGEVRTPKILRAPIGMSFSDCVLACGGSREKHFKLIHGGPMMGQVFPGEKISDLYVTKTTSGIILIPDTDNFIARMEELSLQKILNRAKSACIQCRFCTDLCPRQLIGHKLRPHMVMRRMSSVDIIPEKSDSVLREALLCSECGICETFACPMGLSPRQVNKYVKKQFAGTRYERDGEEPQPDPLREYRKIAPRKVMARMGLGSLYNNQAADFQDVRTDIVRIPLKQHIGIPAAPVVVPGDKVAVSQLIAEGDGKKPSANIHASIGGVVTSVSDFIEIRGGA